MRIVVTVILACVILTGSAPGENKDDVAELNSQYMTLQKDLERLRSYRFADQVFCPESLVTRSDKDPLDVVLRRTSALLEDIKKLPGAPDMQDFTKSLSGLKAKAITAPAKQRYSIYLEACRLRRKISFSNPLLDFDKILFIKKHRTTLSHMCDQYYGNQAVPGGGLFVIKNPFSENPVISDVLKNSLVTSGRLKGKKLTPGAFLSPELSYDGKKIYFAYVECTGGQGHITHLDHANRGHWSRGRCYHIFSVNVDGSDLKQLTDGTWNDFDPCLLPSGRLVFISERRGGYLRCGRACPTYTVHDMKTDGSDIRILSPHENNEWHPSVMHDGMLLYTRWDYVDRHGCTAHHPWVMSPDGRDSRSIHGNFSVKQERADMEMDLLVIPGSHKITGTAAPHHGEAYGSIIIIDPRVRDDDAMAPVKRITPEVDFPESQAGRQIYGTPWPLSESYYLCVYDASFVRNTGLRGDYGIYLLDKFGNKELIYRDPRIGCLSPIPLRSRTRPPELPDKCQRLAKDPPKEGTMAVINVYDTLKPWDKDIRIKALRIYQIYPCSVPSGYRPHETGVRIHEARDSVNLARSILGTVPVEKDGSAYFKVPALKQVSFQALDKDGLAVTSVRSSTWVQPGEQLVCMGCHEPKGRAPSAPGANAIALKRSPSVPVPDVDGTRPFSYPRLVQPVLERNCLPCHEKNKDKKPPRLDRGVVDMKKSSKSQSMAYSSYQSLIPYGFTSYGDHYRTIPGRFGARASRLYKMLKKGHHDVKLSREDMHRITVWLDSVSNFYGVYEKEGGEAQLRGEIVYPTLE